MVTILPRSAWDAGPNQRTNRPLVAGNQSGATVHYPGSPGRLTGYSFDQVAALIKSWQRLHVSKGWRDIGYNYLIDGAGRAWEGCGLYQGAHAGSVIGNATTTGVNMIVGIGEQPTEPQLNTFRELRRDVVLARNGGAVWVRPHSFWTSTACCGDPLRHLIATGALGIEPVYATASPPRGEPMSYPVRNKRTGGEYVVSHEAVTHLTNPKTIVLVRNLLTTEDVRPELEDAEMFELCKALGIPWSVFDANGLVLNPETRQHAPGETWSRSREAMARLEQALAKAAKR